ncbi:alpha-amylase family glycosyl hydrolase [Zhihengliuella salsuginis]|uniref:Alpha-glucosidase n=1 Tax=Zhihengliuella salsuginis TaxID=578222 RepID=A0ABQ3GJ47_9MICC|nr:alpha-amylase family glycosyl hydrolase [Zhihengliuella salsuginis]GHD06364.1 alpha-glucosidase [Zhihengliuella salsuginis]
MTRKSGGTEIVDGAGATVATVDVDSQASTAAWWESGVVYQVYPRSFADADGDGTGDLQGIIERLPYIAALGVNGIWLTPFQPSPGVDQGYDVQDYCGVDPQFGTLEDFDELLRCSHALGLRVLIDVVPNHTSTEHPLFKEALAAGPGSQARQLFHMQPSAAGSAPPNNWQSVFGGPAWSRANPESETDTDWYLHLFSPAQPDWNWENSAVWEMFDDVLSFWFDRGVDGARIDVAHGLFKAEGLPDSPVVPTVIDGLRSNPLAMDRERVHEVYRRWRRLADSYESPRLLVGEVNLEPERSARYTRPDEMHQTFAFAFARLGWDPEGWADAGRRFEAMRLRYGASPTWALENHDLVRTVTRFGGGERGARRARAGALSTLGFPGGAYLYQGQELGVPEVDVPEHLRLDPMWSRGGVSRDGARVPFPWTADDEKSYGFTTSATAEPWLPQPEGWGQYSVEAQETDAASMLILTRKALRLRAELVERGLFAPHAGAVWSVDQQSLTYLSATGLAVVVAMGESPVPLPGTLLLSSEPVVDGFLPADAAAWVLMGDGRGFE